MKIKTSELIGPALDWAVAVAADRLDAVIRDEEHRPGAAITDIGFDEAGRMMIYVPGPLRIDPYTAWSPSTIWDQGGPIIERKGIRIEPEAFDGTGFKSWRADIPKGPTSPHGYTWLFGPTPLIAAMRCFVASNLGDEVDVPEELNASST